MEKIMVTAKEAAELLHVSLPTFYQIAAADGFPSVRVGRKILVSVDGLKGWIRERYGNNIA